jgi:flagellar biogenesis protein FliO
MEMFQQLLMIAVVLGTLVGGVWWLKRKGYATTGGISRFRRPNGAGYPRLEVLDRLALTPQHSLHLVRLADRTMLIGLSPNGCNLIESGKDLPPAFSSEMRSQL